MTKYDQEFKEHAVRLALERKIPLKRLANDLGIGRSTLINWIASYKKGNYLTSGETTEQKEIRRLKKENDILREERDILKKAMAIFSSPKKIGSLL